MKGSSPQLVVTNSNGKKRHQSSPREAPRPGPASNKQRPSPNLIPAPKTNTHNPNSRQLPSGPKINPLLSQSPPPSPRALNHLNKLDFEGKFSFNFGPSKRDKKWPQSQGLSERPFREIEEIGGEYA